MIYLTTGTPGSGKTLNTIEIVHKRAKKEGRQVYYTNIKNVIFDDWIEFSIPEKWIDDLPDGAIWFVDEFYIDFPKLGNNSKRPSHYQELAIHRHKGLDIYFVCQGTLQIDSFIKTLIFQHNHYMRHAFIKGSWRFKQQDLMSSPTSKQGRANAEKTFKKDNKEYYGSYKSTVVDTSTKRIPLLYYFFFSSILLCLIFLYFLYYSKEKMIEDAKIKDSKNSEISEIFTSSFTEKKEEFNPIMAYVPRIKGLPETAPAYDDLQRAQDFPRANCIMSVDICKCYTQQATLMVNYPRDICVQNVLHGKFDATKPRYNANEFMKKDKLANINDEKNNEISQFYYPEYNKPESNHFTTHWEREIEDNVK